MSIVRRLLQLVFTGCLLFILFGCASRAPLPTMLNIVPPSSDIPPRLAAFSGIWQEQGFDIVLVVERIDSQKAEVILSFGVAPGNEPHYNYYTAQVTSDSSFEFTEPNGDKFIFEMNEGLNNIVGTAINKKTGGKWKIYMSRRIIKQ